MSAHEIAVNTRHSLFARILPQTLTDDFQTARADPDAAGLQDEIALLRTFLAHYLSTFHEDQPITAEDLDRVARHVERISRLVVRQARILAENPEHAIREAMLAWTKKLTDVMLQVLQEFLPDDHTRDAAARRFAELMAHQDLANAEPAAPQEPDKSRPQNAPPRPAQQDGNRTALPSHEPTRDSQPDSRLSTLDSRLYSFNLEAALQTARNPVNPQTPRTQTPAGNRPQTLNARLSSILRGTG